MALTIAFIASIYLTGAIILVSEICSNNVWFEDEDGMLYLVITQQ
ncbi:MAG: hypothetical protein QM715_04510 [Nibricoccus sp.]